MHIYVGGVQHTDGTAHIVSLYVQLELTRTLSNFVSVLFYNIISVKAISGKKRRNTYL